MAIEGTKISALPELASEQVTDMVVLSYFEDTPKKNYKVPYTNIKERISEDIIDQHYNPESENAQSGFAVAEAIEQLDLEARFAEKADITFVNEVENTINEKLDTKADKTTTDALQAELDSLGARMESAEDTLLVHAEEIEKKATKDELQEAKDEIEESVKELTDDLQREINERIGSMEIEVQKKANQKELEDTKSELLKDIQDLKQDIIDGVLGGCDIDEEKLNEILADYIKRDEYENDIIGLRDEDEILHLLHDENVAALETKASKDDISEIYEEIEKLKQEKIILDDYVSPTSQNGVTSEGIYNYVTGQGFLTENDVERFKPFEPVTTSTPEGTNEKAAYWFILDKKYVDRGYLTNIRFKTGEQPEVEEPELPDIEDGDIDWEDFEGEYDYQPYMTVAVCRVVRDESNNVKEFIPLGYSIDYNQLMSNAWMSFDFDNVTMGSQDEIAIVFCESSYDDTNISDYDAKLLSVVVMASPVVGDDSSLIYTDSGEEKFIVEAEVDYNKPLSTTVVEVTDVIDESTIDDNDVKTDEYVINGDEPSGDMTPIRFSEELSLPSGKLTQIKLPLDKGTSTIPEAFLNNSHSGVRLEKDEWTDRVNRLSEHKCSSVVNEDGYICLNWDDGIEITEDDFDGRNKFLSLKYDDGGSPNTDVYCHWFTDTCKLVDVNDQDAKNGVPDGTIITFTEINDDGEYSEFVTEVKYATSPKAIVDYVNYKLSDAGITADTDKVIEKVTESVKDSIKEEAKKVVGEELLEIETQVASNTTRIQQLEQNPTIVICNKSNLPAASNQKEGVVYLVFAS